MTNELEKQFFDTFGIEPKILNGCKFERCLNINKGVMNCIKEECCHFYKDKVEYPQITDRILLELTAIHSCWCLPRLCCFNVEQLKEQILSDLTLFNDERIELIHQVRTLFEEGN